MDVTSAEVRPEETDVRVTRVAARFFRYALDEGLTPYEATVAWKRAGVLLIDESPSAVTTRALMSRLVVEMGLGEKI
jgi:hypothetical protein